MSTPHPTQNKRFSLIFMAVIMLLGVSSAIFMMVVEPSTTKLIGLVGLAFLAAGGWPTWRSILIGSWHGDARFLRITIPQIYQEARAARGPRSVAWRTALNLGGSALMVLSS
jgi:hypothetical protein